VSVDFDAPTGCSDRDTFSSGLRSRSSRIRVSDEGASGWSVSVKLSQKEHGVHGELRLTDAQGGAELRVVEGSDCAEVVEALSLTAALAIERIEALDAPAQSSNEKTNPAAPTPTPNDARTMDTSRPAAPAKSVVNDPVHVPAEPRTATDDASDFHFLLSVLLTQRVRPTKSFGFSGALFRDVPLRGEWLSEFGLGVIYVPDDDVQPASELKVSYLGAAAFVCPLTLKGRTITTSTCGTFDVGRLVVADRHVDTSIPSRRSTVTAGALGRLRWNVSHPGAIELDLGLLVPLVDRRYDAHFPAVQVGRSGPVAWQVGIGWLFGF
jgi:hypothetical protein